MISIAMATYNGEKYVHEQIESILAQTVQDFELIICDDKSTDRTLEILREYEQKDPRVKVFENERNLGFKENFQKAAQLCTGEYIAFSDQDDIWEKNHLEVLIRLIGDKNAACADSVLLYDNDNSLLEKKTLSKNDNLLFIHEDLDVLLYRILCNTNVFAGHNFLVKSTFLKEIFPIPSEVNYHDTWISSCAIISGDFNYSFEEITKYRQHRSNVTKHPKWHAFNAFKHAVKLVLKLESSRYKNTYKLKLIGALRRKFPLTKKQIDIINDCECYRKMREHKTSFYETLRAVKVYLKNYKYIYTQKTNKYRLVRLIEILAVKMSASKH